MSSIVEEEETQLYKMAGKFKKYIYIYYARVCIRDTDKIRDNHRSFLKKKSEKYFLLSQLIVQSNQRPPIWFDLSVASHPSLYFLFRFRLNTLIFSNHNNCPMDPLKI